MDITQMSDKLKREPYFLHQQIQKAVATILKDCVSCHKAVGDMVNLDLFQKDQETKITPRAPVIEFDAVRRISTVTHFDLFGGQKESSTDKTYKYLSSILNRGIMTRRDGTTFGKKASVLDAYYNGVRVKINLITKREFKARHGGCNE